MVINNLQDKFVSLKFMCIKKTRKEFDKTLLYNNIILTSLMTQLKEEEIWIQIIPHNLKICQTLV